MKMYDKKSTNVVEAVDFYSDGTVLVYNPYLNGGNWITIQRKRLIPADYAKELIEAKEKAKALYYKNRLTLVYAEWKTTDGHIYDNLETAIQHEKEIMENESK